MTTSIGRSPEIPYAHKTFLPQPITRRAGPPAAAAAGWDKSAGWRVPGTDARRRGRCRRKRNSSCARVQAISKARDTAPGAVYLCDQMQARASRVDAATVINVEFLSLARIERHPAAQAEDRIDHRSRRSAQARSQRRRVFRRLAAAEKFRAVRLDTECSVSVSAPTRTCAVQIGVSPGDRGRRCAISTPGSGHSVSTNIFANAGCALSAACGVIDSSTIAGEFQLARAQRAIGDPHRAAVRHRLPTATVMSSVVSIPDTRRRISARSGAKRTAISPGTCCRAACAKCAQISSDCRSRM